MRKLALFTILTVFAAGAAPALQAAPPVGGSSDGFVSSLVDKKTKKRWKKTAKKTKKRFGKSVRKTTKRGSKNFRKAVKRWSKSGW